MGNLTNFAIEHCVEFRKDGLIFATGREYDSNRIRSFLILNHGRVFFRQGINQAWIEVPRDAEDIIRGFAESAKQRNRWFVCEAHFTN